MLNIVIPMAGRGSRFANAGFDVPKPLIKIHNKTLIECVTENIRPRCPHRFIYICLEEHINDYNLKEYLKKIAPGCVIVPVNAVTEGAACTVLLAEEYINNDAPMMIANSDQFVNMDINDYLNGGYGDGYIMTMKANDTKWSYIKSNDNKYVDLVREKEVISDEATVGIYNYKAGAEFVKYAKQMIDKDIRVNNEFYVAPVYNEMIEAGLKIGYINVGNVENGMYGLGTPEDLKIFQENSLSVMY